MRMATVTSTDDTAADAGTGTNRSGTLREALNFADLDPGTTIRFSAGGVGTIALQSDLPLVSQSTTVVGRSGVAIDGAGQFHDLFVTGIPADGSGTEAPLAIAVRLADLTVQNVAAQGGAVGDGGDPKRGGVAHFREQIDLG